MDNKKRLVGMVLTAIMVLSIATSALPLSVGNRISGAAAAKEPSLPVEVSFKEPNISKINEFDVITVEDCGFTSNVGEPMIPVRTVFVFVPPDMQVKDVQFSVVTRTLPDTYYLYPSQLPANTYFVPDFVEPNPEIYNLSSPIPAEPVEFIGTTEFRGYKLALINVYPIKYVPKTGEATFIESVQLQLIAESAVPSKIPPKMTAVDNWVANNVLNPGVMSEYIPPLPASPGIDYLIITRDMFFTQATDLKNYKDSIGVPTAIETVDDITANYSGRDVPEKVRNCVIDYYQSEGIQWVLLMGDADPDDYPVYTLDKTWEVPTRYMYNPDDCKGGWELPYDDYTPTDYYYAGLNGTWDADGDSKFGEGSVYSTVDEADWYPEVYVGRITARTTSEMNAQVQKIINHPGGPVTNMLMCGAVLDDTTDEKELKEHIQTNFVPPEVTVTGLYESDHTLTETNVINAINSDQPEVVNSACHGSYYSLSNLNWPYDWYSWFTNSTPASLTNDPFLWYAASCLSGGYDNKYGAGADCIGEKAIKDANGTSIAFVGTTRASWYYSGPSHLIGLNGKQDWLFWQEFFTFNDDKPGTCLYNSKLTYLGGGPNLAKEYERKNLFAYQLLGDPEISITREVAPPDIWVNPTSFDVTLSSDTTYSTNLTIGNDGNATLIYNLSDIETTDGLGESSIKGTTSKTFKNSAAVIESGLKLELKPSKAIICQTSVVASALNELVYDDGSAENAYAWGVANNRFAVRFTPPSHPANIKTAKFCFWADWPDLDHEEFAVEVYDDDGPGGAPGTLLGTVNTTPTDWGWHDVDISGLGITITSGDFYIAERQLAASPNCEGLCVDVSEPHYGRSWDWDSGSWSLWPSENYMIRCVVDSPGLCSWLDENPKFGSVDPSSYDEINVTINTAGLSAGKYSANIIIENNDPDENPVIIPVHLTVEQEVGYFDTGSGTYPSIRGTHTGTIRLNKTIVVHKMYTYPCVGTGGHTEYVRFYGNGLDVNKTWNGYIGDYHNIIFDPPITLEANTTYNYEIRTGSYPQIIHEQSLPTANGTINCTLFTDANSRTYNNWIPAMRLE